MLCNCMKPEIETILAILLQIISKSLEDLKIEKSRENPTKPLVYFSKKGFL